MSNPPHMNIYGSQLEKAQKRCNLHPRARSYLHLNGTRAKVGNDKNDNNIPGARMRSLTRVFFHLDETRPTSLATLFFFFYYYFNCCNCRSADEINWTFRLGPGISPLLPRTPPGRALMNRHGRAHTRHKLNIDRAGINVSCTKL